MSSGRIPRPASSGWTTRRCISSCRCFSRWVSGCSWKRWRVLNLATYVIAFVFFATIYEFDLSLLTASFAAGIVSLLLAIEVLREEEMDTYRTLAYALAIGVLLGETAWTTHFLPLEGSSAAVFLLLALYLMTGMMHNYLADRLSLRTASEFTVVALGGLVAVTLSHAYL